MILSAFENNFETYGRADTIQAIDHHGEYFSKDLVYGFESHSFISTEQMNPNDFVTTIASKSKFLVRKFFEDIEDGGNIFVYNFFEEKLPSLDILAELASALSQKVRNYLFAIGLPGQYCLSENTVFHHQPGLILATKDSFTTFNSTPALYRPGWMKICRQALTLIEQHDHDFWKAHQQRISERIAETSVARPNVGNLCIGKSATQSSISPYSIGRTREEDAKGAIDGNANGQVKFHTDFEDNPWWQVDLGDIFGISEVKIYNRIDVPGVMARTARIAVEIGLQPDNLVEIYRRESDDPFGGVDGNGWSVIPTAGPLTIKPSIPIPGRYVRVRLLTRNFLHLDQVEVYGKELSSALFN